MPISVDHIVDALASLGGRAHLDQIEARVVAIAFPPLPEDPGASIRARMQERCSEARSYKGGPNLFRSVHGVEARLGWWELRVPDPLSTSLHDAVQDGPEPFIEDEEGKAMLRIHLRRERSQKLIRAFKESLDNLVCAVCDFDFEATYGELGKGYVEAHHTIPVANLKEGATTRLADLVALCANCHRVIHRNKVMGWKALRERLRREGPTADSD